LAHLSSSMRGIPIVAFPNTGKIVPIADRHFEYANEVKNKLLSKGIRVEVDEQKRKDERKD